MTSLISGFHPSINGDRKVGADFFDMFFGTLIGDGVFPNPSTGFQVVEGDGLQTIVRTGSSWIRGKFAHNPTDYVIQHDLADGVLKRIDRIVIRRDKSIRDVIITVKKGTFASNPVAPNLQRDGAVWELALADVFIGAGATQITQADITDNRLNTELCGIVHGLVDQVDTTTIFNQYQSYFNEWSAEQRQDFEDWFDSIKDILDGDVATNLAQLIATQRLDFENHLADYVKHPAIVTSTNVANDYAVTLNPAPISYIDGLGLVVTINANSTNETTMRVNNLGAVPIKKADGKPVKNLKANGVYTLRYSVVNSAFILQGEGGIDVTGVEDVQYLAGEDIAIDTVCKVVREKSYSQVSTYANTGIPTTYTTKTTSATEDKKYLAVGFWVHPTNIVAGTTSVKLYKNVDGVMNDITTNFDIPPTFSIEDVAFSPDGSYLAVSETAVGKSKFWIYKRVGDNFIKQPDIPLFDAETSHAIMSASWTPNAEYLAAASISQTFGTVVFKNNFDGTFTKLPDLTLITKADMRIAKFSPKGNYLFISSANTSYRYNMYKRVGDTFTRLTTPSQGNNANISKAFWGPNDIYIHTSLSAANNTYMYVNNNDVFTMEESKNPIRTIIANYISYSADKRYMLVLFDTAPTIRLYIVNTDLTFTQLPNALTNLNDKTGVTEWVSDTLFTYLRKPDSNILFEGLRKHAFKMSYTESGISEIAISNSNVLLGNKFDAIKIWGEE